MIISSQRFGRGQWPVVAVAAAVVLCVGGWGSIHAQTDTEREAARVLRDLKINPGPEPNIPMPEFYKAPPRMVEQTVGGVKEFKLFYFCKYHTSEDLKKIIHEQFATKIFDPKGKATTLPSYTVSSNPATNQLIVRCPTREDVEAILETLLYVDVQPVQVKIDCLISEIYADMTFDRETTIAIEDLLGEDIAMKPAGTAYGANVRQLVLDDSYLPAFPGASLREVARSRMGLNVGYLSTTHAFTVLVDLLESRGYLKILMNPTLEVVNGKTAKVLSSQHVPLERTSMRSTQSDYLEMRTEYVDVIDSLEITPHVFGDGYIGLETTIVLGSKNTPEGVKQIPIITKKQIDNKENRIRQGQSLVIGGIRKNEEFAVVRGVPILKDIPLIGFLFSSEDTERRAVETIFILTPTVSTGGVPRDEVIKQVREKHKPSSPEDVHKSLSDILGGNSRKEEEQLKTQEAEAAEQNQADADKEGAGAEEGQGRANKTEGDDKTEADADEKAKAAEQSQANADNEGAGAEEGQGRTNEAEAEDQTEAAAKAKAAEEAKAAADKAAADAAKAQEAADEAKAQADAKAKAAEEAIAEANGKAKAAEQNHTDADKEGAGAEEGQGRANETEAEDKTDADAKAEKSEAGATKA